VSVYLDSWAILAWLDGEEAALSRVNRVIDSYCERAVGSIAAVVTFDSGLPQQHPTSSPTQSPAPRPVDQGIDG
jgi:hypothetical protein